MATPSSYGERHVEYVVLVSDDGEPIGIAEKDTVHGANTPYHLAFSCYAFDREARLLVTRRAYTKRTWPGALTNTCCGHPEPGENVHDAVSRRMWQELGLVPHGLRLALPTFSYRAEDGGVVEHELCPVFLCRIEENPRPNPEEVADFVWWPWQRFCAAAAVEDSSISPWARLQIEELNVGKHVARYFSQTNLHFDTNARPMPVDDH